MPREKLIPDEIREQVIAIVNQFNADKTWPAYIPRFRGAFLYLDRVGLHERPLRICRLKWTGKMDAWEFAIYKYSQDKYDPDEWWFSGAGKVDGAIIGAMRAGREAYPD